jgi:hypothetical protein
MRKAITLLAVGHRQLAPSLKQATGLFFNGFAPQKFKKISALEKICRRFKFAR